jgi:predicted RNA-binding protein with PUA-like domain
MAHWLMKSEPDAYSWDDLVRDGKTEWTGVKNAQAAINLRAMKAGDEAFFYHSNVGLEAVGIMTITRIAAPDPTDAKWVSVEVAPVRALKAAVTLKAMKADSRLANLPMIRQSRLSVSPVGDAEWAVMLEMAGGQRMA